MFKYPVIIERAKGNFSAYCPDLPGCVASGATVEETVYMIKEAIKFHIEGMKADGLSVPEPSAKVKYIEVAV